MQMMLIEAVRRNHVGVALLVVVVIPREVLVRRVVISDGRNVTGRSTVRWQTVASGKLLYYRLCSYMQTTVKTRVDNNSLCKYC